MKLPIDWKILVRAEGYGWSHGYCNQYKSQMPFISLKYKNKNYEYIIEINNILQYLAGMFDVSQEELLDYFPWYKDKPYKEEPAFKKIYNDLPMKNEWKTISQAHQNKKNKKAECVRAFYNIIDMLIPTYFLLNVGRGIDLDVKKVAEEKFKDIGANKQRTFISEMNKYTIAGRLQDNIGRVLGWLNKKNNSHFRTWLEGLNLKNEDDKNPISKYFDENLTGKMQDNEGVLELFKGSFFTKKDDDVEDEEDLIEMVKKDNSITTIYEDGDTGGMALGKIEARSLNFKPKGTQQRKRSHSDIEAESTGETPKQQRMRMEAVSHLENKDGDALDKIIEKGGRRKRTRRRRKKKKKRSKRKRKGNVQRKRGR